MSSEEIKQKIKKRCNILHEEMNNFWQISDYGDFEQYTNFQVN